MYCDGCGTQLTSGGQFCTKCGKPISRAQPRHLLLWGTLARLLQQRPFRMGACSAISTVWRFSG